MSTDKLFQEGEIRSDFQFNERVAEVFDDMLARSVPNYEQVIEMTALLLERFLHPGDRIYDLGCSTGNTLLHLARRLNIPELRFTGVDNSQAMISKARLKAEMYSRQGQLDFAEGDITDFADSDSGAILLNYTLQFIRPPLRPELLTRLHAALRPGGVLILSEKVISHDPLLNRTFLELYFAFKRSKGYSEMEIAKKREALENVLIPFSIRENLELLTQAGFQRAETFCQWFNFVSLVAVKGE